jgi:DNA repair protein RadC
MAESILTQVEDFQPANPEQAAWGHGDTGTKPKTPRKRKAAPKGTKWGHFGNNPNLIPPGPLPLSSSERAVVDAALAILEGRLQKGLYTINGFPSVCNYLCLAYAGLTEEHFGVMFLNAAHQLIAFEQMFRGTVNEATVYPREVLRRALALNAVAVIVAHNHPSGDPTPSQNDKLLTLSLKNILRLVNVKLLDHIIVGGAHAVSMEQRGFV